MPGLRKLAARAALVAGVVCALSAGALAQDSENSQKIRDLPWQVEPAVGKIADKATVPLTGMRFLDSAATDKFMQLTGNLPRQNSYLLGRKDLAWFAVLDFVPEGYVKDDEKIDAAKLLAVLKEGNEAGAQERKKRGLPSLILDGWQMPPQYDAENKRLEWATVLHSDGGEKVVNYSTKLLARRGYTTAVLVSDPANFTSDVAEFKAALKTVQYVPGESYAEFKQGDKIAAYGLGALIVGGAAAMATKKGFWAAAAAFFAAFWKLIIGAGVALLAGIGAIFKKKQKE
ncbi:DUF2167 domain-containing protein [Ramlibacter sp. WS9]|uniref:DUF2167 domain-containing protein n=1 Tax=Ramlibacter sp. WS9 TaxID=1882741 RepID=UPI0013052611|nr:DUF2167 domain-containing protein [Ramlibacter sp. WS9]